MNFYTKGQKTLVNCRYLCNVHARVPHSNAPEQVNKSLHLTIKVSIRANGLQGPV